MSTTHMRSRPMMFESLESRRLLAYNPSAADQELMQLVNRFRVDPKGEYSRLIATTSPLKARDPLIQAELEFAKVNGTALKAQFDSLKAAPPLAWNEAVSAITAGHNAEMIASKTQKHSDAKALRAALEKAGIKFRAANELIWGENVFGFGKTPLHIFASFVLDWRAGDPNGIQPGTPHLANLINANFDQIGQAITPYSGSSSFGPLVTTQVLVNIENPPLMVVGSLFEDRNSSTWYDAGEGIGSAQIVFSGPAGTFTTKSLTAGGYQIELPAGTYTATATGGGMKYAVVQSNIVVGTTNVWKNLIYDPTKPPPDRLEANNTIATATLLTGSTQTITGLSIHTASDVDYFRLNSLGTGPATITINFSNAAGNLDLRLLTPGGTELAKSTTATDNETLTANLTRNTTYYIQVLGSAGAINSTYSLTVTPPAPAPPVAELDRAIASSLNPKVTINLVANDRDPDGTPSKLTARLSSGTPATFVLTGNSLTYTAPKGFSGVQRASYTVTDDQGLTSVPGSIEVFVLDFAKDKPWHNTTNAVDTNADGLITPIDALTIINELNLRHARPLPRAGDNLFNMFGFLDSYADGLLTPQDALAVINSINLASRSTKGSGEGQGIAAGVGLVPAEGEQAPWVEPLPQDALQPTALPTPISTTHDMAFAALYGDPSSSHSDLLQRRRKANEGESSELNLL